MLDKVPVAGTLSVGLRSNLLTPFGCIQQGLVAFLNESKLPDADHASTAEAIAAITVGDRHVRSCTLTDEPVDAMTFVCRKILPFNAKSGQLLADSCILNNELVRINTIGRFCGQIRPHDEGVVFTRESAGSQGAVCRRCGVLIPGRKVDRRTREGQG